MKVALDAETETALDALQFGEADIAELGTTHAEVAEAEENVRLVGHHLGDEPGRGPGGVEEFDDRHMVGFDIGGLRWREDAGGCHRA